MTSSRPISRQNSSENIAIHVPVDPRVSRPGLSRQNSARSMRRQAMPDQHHHHHQHQDPKLFGPGFTSAPTHSAADANVKYVLVTSEMLHAIESGNAPLTTLVHPPGTHLRSSAAQHLQNHELHPRDPIETKPSADGTLYGGPAEKAEHAHLSHTSEDDQALTEGEGEPFLPNPIARLRHKFKEPFGEFIGTMILIIFGNGVNCQVVLSRLTQGSYLSISFGWGIGVMFGVYTAGGISGAHLNPAVTISLAAFRGFPWRKVPGYVIGQVAGAFLGSCLIQGNYHNLINEYEGGYNLRTFGGENSTGALFFTQAQSYMSNIGAFFSEFFATAVLLAVILALGDANNNPAPAGMNGMILLWLIVGIGAALGTQTAYCLNPARDFGPRLAAWAYGYPRTIWTYRNWYWIWTPILACITGGLMGCLFYDFFIFAGPESPLNRPWGANMFRRGRKNTVEDVPEKQDVITA